SGSSCGSPVTGFVKTPLKLSPTSLFQSSSSIIIDNEFIDPEEEINAFLDFDFLSFSLDSLQLKVKINIKDSKNKSGILIIYRWVFNFNFQKFSIAFLALNDYC